MRAIIITILLFLGVSVATGNRKPSAVVPKCGKFGSDSDSSGSRILVNQKSDGSGPSTAKASVQLCYSPKYLQVTYTMLNQKYLPSVRYSECNDPIYDSDEIEIFVGPLNDNNKNSGTKCYTQVDFSPYGTSFQSGIFNPNLNRTRFIQTRLNCSTSGILSKVSLSLDSTNETVVKNTWKVQTSIPWSLIDCVPGCPLSSNHHDDDHDNDNDNDNDAAVATVGHDTNNNDSSLLDRRKRRALDTIPSLTSTVSDASENKKPKCTAPSRRSGMMYYANFYRINELNKVATCTTSDCEYIAWSPTYVNPPAFHEPLYFGTIVLE